MILSIESSCDDSSIAVTRIKDKKLLFHKKISQELIHSKYGGVVPELAARLHAIALPNILEETKKYFDDLKARVNIFIIYRNPKNILNKILNQFQEGEFHSVLEKDSLINGPSFEGKVPETVNSYLFRTYLVSRSIPELNFSFTNLPTILDKNLSENYKKHGSIEKYLRKFIDK